MTNYRNGYELERAAKRLLEDNGYYVVRAAGSKGAADLVALKRGEVVLVQCKLDGYLPPMDRQTLAALGDEVGGTPVVAGWHKEGRAARQIMLGEVHRDQWESWIEPWSPDWAMEET